jgi:hypothetical protein
LTRRRIASLQAFAGELRDSIRRRRQPPPKAPDRRTSAELERRLDETRDRLRREIPPREESEQI